MQDLIIYGAAGLVLSFIVIFVCNICRCYRERGARKRAEARMKERRKRKEEKADRKKKRHQDLEVVKDDGLVPTVVVQRNPLDEPIRSTNPNHQPLLIRVNGKEDQLIDFGDTQTNENYMHRESPLLDIEVIPDHEPSSDGTLIVDASLVQGPYVDRRYHIN